MREQGTQAGDGPIGVALVGFGMAGRVFHAPLITGAGTLALKGIVSSRPGEVHSQWPGMTVYPTLVEALQDPGIELVVIATDNQSHHPLALQALQARRHVVVDKPCTVTLAQTDELLATAAAQDRVLTVFQNRRFDADFLQLQDWVRSGRLGRLVHLVSHFDRFRPQVPGRWRDRDLPGSGLWMDLGPHLIDQALVLFGVPDDLLLDCAVQRDGAESVDYFHAELRYVSRHHGLRVSLHASALVAGAGLRFAAHGTQGSWLRHGLDPQEDQLKAGQRPIWGQDGSFGVGGSEGEHVTWPDGERVSVPVAPGRGRYLDYYRQVGLHLQARRQGVGAPVAELPVRPHEVRQVMALLERGLRSSQGQCWVDCRDLAVQT